MNNFDGMVVDGATVSFFKHCYEVVSRSKLEFVQAGEVRITPAARFALTHLERFFDKRVTSDPRDNTRVSICEKSELLLLAAEFFADR